MHYQPKRDLLENRIILVTGASDGIGLEAALTYARYGAKVILLGRNEEKLRHVAQRIEQVGGKTARWYTLDLATCTPEQCQQLAAQIEAAVPRLDGVVPCPLQVNDHKASDIQFIFHNQYFFHMTPLKSLPFSNPAESDGSC